MYTNTNLNFVTFWKSENNRKVGNKIYKIRIYDKVAIATKYCLYYQYFNENRLGCENMRCGARMQTSCVRSW
jgi:hypothetical protein